MGKFIYVLLALTPTAVFFTLTSEHPRLFTLLTVAVVAAILAIITRKPAVDMVERIIEPEYTVVDPDGVTQAWCHTNLDAERAKFRLDKITRVRHAIVHTPKENN